MNEILQKNRIEVAHGRIPATGLKGPLQEGRQKQVQAFASALPRRGGQ